MNYSLFFHVIAWATLICTGILNLINFLKILVGLMDDKIKNIRLYFQFYLWIVLFVIALAYVISS